MLEVKLNGPWDSLQRLFKSREKRLNRMKHEIVREVVKKFKKDVKSRLPSTPEMKAYMEAVKERRIAGSFKKGNFAYALIVLPEEMDLAELNPSRTAVYVAAKKDNIGDLSRLLIEEGPWVVDRLPMNVSENEVKLVHRDVTEDEILRLRQKNDATLKKMKGDFDAAGARFERKEEELDPPKSMPDLAFRAIRMEFGIKHKQIKHWGYAVDRMNNNLKEMLRRGGKFRKYISDPFFTGWNSPMKVIRKIPLQEFTRDYLEFQKKVVR